ncbi:MAG: thiamine-phosphate kinase [Myxococcota bacterium]
MSNFSHKTPQTGEFERISKIREKTDRDSAFVRLGNGDDSAVLQQLSFPVVSVDTQVEEVHFRSRWLTDAMLGRRAVVAAASDLFAMGAAPRALLVSLILPEQIDDDRLVQLAEGLAKGADDVGASIVGGNLSCGKQFSITTTVMGDLLDPKKIGGRHGAAPNDGVYITFVPGEAALGLAFLLAETEPTCVSLAQPFMDRWRTPPVQREESAAVLPFAGAMIDVSDGLVQDLNHILKASEVTAELEVAKFPTSNDFKAACASLGSNPLELMLHGGETYGLLFTSTQSPPIGTRIGTITQGVPSTLILPSGHRHPLPTEAGHDHFKQRD